MAGHSKWANIKRRKGAQDAKRGKLFSKLSKAIIVAAKGGADPEANLALKNAIDKAKAGNMPNDTIDTAVKKGAGLLEGITYSEMLYEGYSTGGIAIIVEALSDNRNRTTPEIKKIFESRGGNLGNQGSVSFLFDHKGLIYVRAAGLDFEALFDVAVELGAEDVERGDEVHTVSTQPADFLGVEQAIKDKGWVVEDSEIARVPQTYLDAEAKDLEKAARLVSTLEDHEDVQNVYTNVELPDEDES